MKKFKIHKNRIRNKKAFTLAEMLVAVLIMSFAGMLVMSGLAVITSSFQDLLLHSQTQMVLKEYMSEVRSGFLSADLDSELIIDATNSVDTRPAFTHSGLGCVGYYTVINDAGDEVPNGNTDAALGTIIFQPAHFNYDTNEAEKSSLSATKENYVSLVSTKLSKDFTARIEYRFDKSTQMFSGKIIVKSARKLSSGEQVELSGEFSVSPICRETESGGT